MASAPDYTSITHSPHFTFLVGPNHTRLTIQSGLAKHVSDPLDRLMNSGHTRESKHRIAVLEEEEVETFVAFAEYAYTCDYTVPIPGAQDQCSGSWKERSDSVGSTALPPLSPLDHHKRQSSFAFDPKEGGEGTQGDSLTGAGGGEEEGKTKKVYIDAAAKLTPPSTPPPGKQGEHQRTESLGGPGSTTGGDGMEEPHDQALIDVTWVSHAGSMSQRGGANPWEEFTSLEYIYQPPRWPPPVEEVPYLVFHAKLYVFASRYLIQGLAQLCLKRLHKDLLSFELVAPLENEKDDDAEAERFDAQAKMILDLLHYTYTKTTRLERVSIASPALLRDNELRKLVTHYAACKARELSLYAPPRSPLPAAGAGLGVSTEGFTLRDLLDNTTELAADLVYRMM